MNTGNRLRFLPLFYSDLEETVDYIAGTLKNPDAAEDLVDAVFKEIEARLPVADSFEQYQSSYEPELPYYHIRVRNYLVFYVVIQEAKGKIMEVRRLLYNKRNWREMKFLEDSNEKFF